MFERFGDTNPNYGTLVDAAFPTSQVTHVGVVTAGDPDQVYFHQRTIGVLMTREASVSTSADMASRRIFDLGAGEQYRCWDFDDPRSGSAPSQWMSGRLKYIHFDTEPVVDRREASHLGALGHTAYTWRVTDLVAARAAVIEHGGTRVGDLADDGLGRQSFFFVDTAGYVSADVRRLHMSGAAFTDVDYEKPFAALNNVGTNNKPLDLLVGPEGALYVSTFDSIYRIKKYP